MAPRAPLLLQAAIAANFLLVETIIPVASFGLSRYSPLSKTFFHLEKLIWDYFFKSTRKGILCAPLGNNTQFSISNSRVNVLERISILALAFQGRNTAIYAIFWKSRRLVLAYLD